MEISRIGQKPVEVEVEAFLPSGLPAELTEADFALCDHGGPNAATVWVAGQYTAETQDAPAYFTVTIDGADAPERVGVLKLREARAELWAKPTQGSIVAAGYIDTVEQP